ncbi:MAG: hypothetical protein ACRD2C_04580 [Acidimicrobiales bacterium]
MPRLGAGLPAPIDGMVPRRRSGGSGCRFGNRCPHFRAGLCDAGNDPAAAEFTTHGVRCARHDELVTVGARVQAAELDVAVDEAGFAGMA